MKPQRFKRFLTVTATITSLALAAAPMGLAGEDEEDEGGGGGGGDNGAAVGGAQTGFGGMVASAQPDGAIPIALAGGGIAFLTLAGGLATRKRRFE